MIRRLAVLAGVLVLGTLFFFGSDTNERGATATVSGAKQRVRRDYGALAERVFAPVANVERVFPARGDEAIAMPLANGDALMVSEEGARGERQLIDGAVSYARDGGRVYWSAGPNGRGHEEWLELSAGVAFAERPAARWRVAGGVTRVVGRQVIVADAQGRDLARVTAPAAFALGGQPVAVELRASGEMISLHVDAGGAPVLVDPWWETFGVLRPHAVGHQFLLPNGRVILFGGGTSELYDPTTDTWTVGPAMKANRNSAAAVQLQDGRVLVAGGDGLSSCEIYDPTGNDFTLVDSLNAARRWHSATLLANGSVLVAGGYAGLSALASSEIYDPLANNWTTVDALNVARNQHTATRLSDGRVLVVGGLDNNGNPLASAEVYDLGGTDLWVSAGSLSIARYEHTASILPSGKVLVANGNTLLNLLAHAEIFDPLNAITPWSVAPSPPAYSRKWHSATVLQNGQVLFAGGVGASGATGSDSFLREAEIFEEGLGFRTVTPMFARRGASPATLLANGEVLVSGGSEFDTATSAERYDPVGDTWLPAGTMLDQRVYATASLLDDGRVAVIGGARGSLGGRISTAELYDPTTNRFSLIGDLPEPRHSHTATVLADGRRVLVAGGRLPALNQRTSSAFIYDPDSPATPFTAVASMNVQRMDHTATLLDDGRVLVTGGVSGGGSAVNTAEIFDPMTGQWTALADVMSAARSKHTATLLADGNVLIAGGVGLNSADVFDPTPIVANDFFTATNNNMSANRSAHGAARTADDKVLITGGAGGLTSCDLYDPLSRSFETNPGLVPDAMTTGRGSHTSTTLGGGEVVVIGGRNSGVVSSTEVYDPVSRHWFTGGSLTLGRAYHTATRLADGRVLVAGGAIDTNSQHYASWEIWTPGCAELNGGCDIVTSCVDASHVVVCGLCPAGYSSATGTGAADCVPCAANKYQPSPGETLCLTKTTCVPGTRQVSAGSTTADRTCASCGAGTYTSTSNETACSPHVVPPCGVGEYEATSPSSTSDRVCAPITDCAPGTRETAAPTTTSNRTCAPCVDSYSTTVNASSCTPWSSCAAGSYVSVLPSSTSDRTCAPCSTGFTATANEESCTAWTACQPSEFESLAPTSTADRQCTALTTCAAGSYVTVAETATTDRQCAPCSGGFSAVSNASSCTAFSTCGAGEYEVSAPQSTADRVCAPVSNCTAGQYEATPPSATSNRVCVACAGGSFSSTANASSCSSWSVCASGSYETSAPTATSDRACAACASGTFSSAANASSCTAWSECASGTYEASAPTATSDRVCAACASGTFSTTANASSCVAWSTCAPGSFEVTAPSATSDRACQACTACGEGFVVDQACSATADTTCKPAGTGSGNGDGTDTGTDGETAGTKKTTGGCRGSGDGRSATAAAVAVMIALMLRRRRLRLDL